MKVTELNKLYEDFRFGFRGEFDLLVGHVSFARIFFKNFEPHLKDHRDRETLILLFEASFVSVALSLNRLWDESTTKNAALFISFPNLVKHFEEQRFFGCRSLNEGSAGRKLFEELYKNPLRQRLRVVRTETIAHTLSIGSSRDRASSDISGLSGFNLINGEVLDFAEKSINLLYLVLDDLFDGKISKERDLKALLIIKMQEHLRFLGNFSEKVSS